MIPVRVVVVTPDAVCESLTHVNNRSQHALNGAVRAAWRKFPAAKSISAQFTEHDCSACSRVHYVPTIRRGYKPKPKRRSA